jgi:hypothetical protein
MIVRGSLERLVPVLMTAGYVFKSLPPPPPRTPPPS